MAIDHRHMPYPIREMTWTGPGKAEKGMTKITLPDRIQPQPGNPPKTINPVI
ncbi:MULTISPECIES: hypothetical protein [Streptomyces]|uniref:hypothetical protein n=1 Tax=Streptomyces TaxID=1883 RepID=UPI001415C7B3|nr:MULTISPECIES: hypothetical protein [Streptomyces]MYU57131.1 hypothetical protein [Streptomyces sp. SID7805]